jgi:serine/threonine-protein kinase
MLIKRFWLERQILAGHDGQPYLVMDFVDGVPLDIYCDEKRLTAEERLRLFLWS